MQTLCVMPVEPGQGGRLAASTRERLNRVAFTPDPIQGATDRYGRTLAYLDKPHPIATSHRGFDAVTLRGNCAYSPLVWGPEPSPVAAVRSDGGVAPSQTTRAAPSSMIRPMAHMPALSLPVRSCSAPVM